MAYRPDKQEFQEFISLFPKGTGFEQSDDPYQEQADEVDREIQKKREEALKLLGIKKDSMKTVYEWERFAINKEKFVLEQEKKLDQRQLHLLIADRGVLFNTKYQDFFTNVPAYIQLIDQAVQRAEQDAPSLSASDKALLNMPKTFHPHFYKMERDEYSEGMECYKRLETLFKEIQPCTELSSDLSSAFEFLFLYSKRKYESSDNKDLNKVNVDQVFTEVFSPHISRINQAASVFIQSAGFANVIIDSEPMLKSVILAFNPVNSKVDLTELLTAFVITCVRCPRFLFKYDRGINLSFEIEKEKTAADMIYSEIHSVRQQNDGNVFANLYRFLNALMDIFQFDDENRRKCDAYFDRLVFGTEPRLLDKEYKKLAGSSIPQSPMTSYFVETYDYIEKCMDSDPVNLSGYHIGSLLHTGGFAQFLKQYPNVVPNLNKRISEKIEDAKKETAAKKESIADLADDCRQEESIADLADQYRQKAYQPVHWLDETRQEYEESIQAAFRFAEISIDELNQFFSSLTSQKLTKNELESNRNELKDLLTELSIREYSITKAKEKLRKALYDLLDGFFKNVKEA